MRNSYLLYAMGAGLAFTACSSEENVPNVDSVLEKDQSFYVNVAITTNSDIATRANSEDYNGTGNPDFEKGLDSESEVNQVYFVFYDSKGIVVGQPVSVNVNDLGTSTDYDGGNILRSYTSVVKVDVNKGEGKPAKVMCYVNPVSTDGLASTLQKVETVMRDKFQDNAGNFSMSNSVYYTDQNLTRAVSITDGQLFNTEQAAIDAVGNDPDATARVLINVERYAAKVKFSYGEGQVIENYTPATSSDETPISLTFVPEKWDVNATDKETFVTKAFRTNEGLGSPAGTNMTFDQVNTELGRKDNWAWNSTQYYRSYWAFSPAYYSNTYPSIAHDILANGEDAYRLKYYSYDYILDKGESALITASQTHRYVKETTVARSGLDSSNPAAAISSAVLAGHYEVYVGGATDPVLVNGANPTFYTMGTSGADNRAQVFFGATLDTDKKIVSEVEGAPTMIEYMADKETVLLVRQGTGENATYTPLTRTNLPNVFNALAIKRPSDDVYAKLGEYSASRTVTLQIKDDFQSLVDAGYALCINVGNGAQEIGEGGVALVDANAALARATQWANRYNEGRAFFNIPIKHLGWYAGTNPNAGLGNSVSNIDYSAARVGDFGLVRNHVYNIVVDHIRGLGTAVSEPGEPIVPPVDTKEYFVAYRLNILNWAIVPVQNVDL